MRETITLLLFFVASSGSAKAEDVFLSDLLGAGYTVLSSNISLIQKDNVEFLLILEKASSVFVCKTDLDVKRVLDLELSGQMTKIDSLKANPAARACVDLARKGLVKE